jgi:chromosome segregation ATPase
MLGKLKTQFSGEKTALEKEELNAQNAFQKLMQGLKSNVDGAESEISSKKTLLAKTQQAKSENEGGKEEAEKELEEDTKYLKETDAMCQVRTSDFNARKKLREDEIASITKARNIIGGDAVKGAGDRNLKFIQVRAVRGRATALAHLRSDPQNPMQGRMAVFLTERARSLNSNLLLDLAQRVSADPFKKVKKMVKDMIVQLMEEATAEMEKKGWCDTELTVNTQTRERKTDEVEELSEEITELSADIARLSQDNAELTKAITALDKAMMEETTERQSSKAAYRDWASSSPQ